jgi:Zn-finger nucleic acid-binding protein
VDASALHCPNCGAAAAPDARRCSYCRARLATISCPSCFALMFEGAAFCQTCGARRARVEASAVSGRCPGCRSTLQHVTIGATSLLECGRCDGVWLDADAFDRVCADHESRAAVLHRWPERPTAGRAERIRYRPCVRCGKMMNRLNFGRLSGTVVDVCRGHGTFLDAGELHAIVTFIEGGGLDRARQRAIEELKEEERRLRDAQSAAVHQAHQLEPPVHLETAGWTASAVFDLIDWLKSR